MPNGPIFSKATNAVSAAMTVRFITPPDKQQQHQRPATSDAVDAVIDSHAEGAPDAGAPVVHQKTQRRLALLQTDALERRELVDAGDDEQRMRRREDW